VTIQVPKIECSRATRPKKLCSQPSKAAQHGFS
ncbi:MAG: hypothetical protein, partial [Olavius algarvensis Gamma 1 endosymbiont]